MGVRNDDKIYVITSSQTARMRRLIWSSLTAYAIRNVLITGLNIISQVSQILFRAKKKKKNKKKKKPKKNPKKQKKKKKKKKKT